MQGIRIHSQGVGILRQGIVVQPNQINAGPVPFGISHEGIQDALGNLLLLELVFQALLVLNALFGDALSAEDAV